MSHKDMNRVVQVPSLTIDTSSSLLDLDESFLKCLNRTPGGAVNSGMAARFVNIDYDTPLFLPPNLRDWVPAGHLAHFILDAVEEMDLRQVQSTTGALATSNIRPGCCWRC